MIYKVFISLAALIGLAVSPKAQVEWKFSSKKISDKVYELHLSATIQPTYTTYSQFTPGGGPEPTSITFNKNTNVLLSDKTKEVGSMHKKYEGVFGVDVHYYENKVEYVQLVKLKKAIKTMIAGNIHYMVCDDEQCVTEDVLFKIELK